MVISIIVPSTFFTVSVTSVPFGPRISCTASSNRMSPTSTASPSFCVTFCIKSFGCKSPCFHEGLPGTMLTTLIYPSFSESVAPIPSSFPEIRISKSSFSFGGK